MTKTVHFNETLSQKGVTVRRSRIHTVQVNLGKRCNQACGHCHVEAGPQRTEMMDRSTIDRLLELIDLETGIETVDVTGGAPELNPHFRYLVEQLRERGLDMIDRCNLTVLFEPGQEDTAEFLRDHRVQVVASLPCYLQDNVDRQRGKGVFDKSIKGLQRLNALGYGKGNTGLVLNLVYNPTGADLPPGQDELERAYKVHLREEWGIEFDRLFTITNMPIKRFSDYLLRESLYTDYMELLVENFNPGVASQVMCTGLVSVGWDGRLYDCDFNQMLEIPANWTPRSLWDIDRLSQLNGEIALDNHCYGCTAGAGSSCGGSLDTH